MSEEERGKRNIDNNSLVDRLSNHFSHKLEKVEVVIRHMTENSDLGVLKLLFE